MRRVIACLAGATWSPWHQRRAYAKLHGKAIVHYQSVEHLI